MTAAAATGCGGGGGGGGQPAPGGGGGGATQPGAVTTLSDPAPCTDRFKHVFVTVFDVKAHMNADAGASDAGFVDLTPMLPANPLQVDLLHPKECFVGVLGGTAIPPGNYQQIRLLLLANEAPPAGTTPPGNNACASLGPNVFNCVQDSGGAMNFHTLALPSEAKTGIKIPPGQLAGGNLTISPNQTLVDIDIDFNACQSVVAQGNGNFKLKPTLRAGELGLNPKITGQVVLAAVNGNTVTPVNPSAPVKEGANVWLEQQSRQVQQGASTEAVENLIQVEKTDSNGNFDFCPVPPGTYEIVADADASATGSTPANATISTGVVVSPSGGPANLTIPLVPESGAAKTINGQVTTTSSSPPGAGDDVALTALQPFSSGTGDVFALIPLLPGTSPAPPVVTTSAPTGGGNCSNSNTCPAGTNCACYSLVAPSSNPVVGAASASGTGYLPPTSSPPLNYQVDSAATIQGSSTPVCSPSELATATFDASTASPATAPTLSFTGCD